MTSALYEASPKMCTFNAVKDEHCNDNKVADAWMTIFQEGGCDQVMMIDLQIEQIFCIIR